MSIFFTMTYKHPDDEIARDLEDRYKAAMKEFLKYSTYREAKILIIKTAMEVMNNYKVKTEKYHEHCLNKRKKQIMKLLIIGFMVLAGMVRMHAGIVESAPIMILNDGEYYHEAVQLLYHASNSVHVLMYTAKYSPGHSADLANGVIEAVKEADNRGLETKIVFDQVTAKDYPETTNYYLQNGVSCRVIPKTRTLHIKMILIDGRIILSGSHNLTISALKYNHELSTVIFSSNLASIEEQYFQSVWNEAR